MNKKITFLIILTLLAVSCRREPVLQPMASQAVQQVNQQVEEAKKSRAVWPPIPNSQIAVDSNPLRKNFEIVLDGSGSMDEEKCSSGRNKIDAAKAAIAAFANNVPADANLGLVYFNPVREVVPLGLNNRQVFTEKLNALYADGGTPLHAAMSLGYNKLTERAVSQLGYGEYTLVVVTDGEFNQGPDPRELVEFIAGNTPVVIFTVGFCIGSEHSLNRPGITTYREANNPEQLSQALGEVLSEAPDFTALDFQ